MDAVVALGDCRLDVSAEPWPFAVRHRAEIAAHWRAAVARNPSLFDGGVFVLRAWRVQDGVLRGTALSAAFSAYHYWRGIGDDSGATEEAFATTVIIGSDGGVLLARSVAGTLNAGRYLSPGGLIDRRDVDGEGRLDLAGAAARELAEETGLIAAEMERLPGFLLAYQAPYLAIASVFRSPLTGAQLADRIAQFLAADAQPELEDPVVVHTVRDLEHLEATPFARLLSGHVLA